MKRFLSLVLCVIIAFSVSFTSSSADKSTESDADPVVFLLGYSTANLYYKAEDSDARRRVWNLYVDADDIIGRVKENIPDVLWGVFSAFILHYYKPFTDVAAVIAESVLNDIEKLTMNADGTSKYDVSVYPYSGEMPFSYQKNYRNVYMNKTYNAIKEKHGRVYPFVVDWRLSQVEIADRLNDYIQQVKEDSGKEKVSLFGFSHGGQSVATYLHYYKDKNDVKRVVMYTPAIGGTSFVTALLEGKDMTIEDETLIRFIQSYMETEAHYEWIGKLLNVNFLKNALLAVVKEHLLPIAGYWGSIWDLVPAEDYERLKSKLLDSVESARLIEQSDKYHYEVLPNISKTLNDARASGIDISIIANYGNTLLFNGKVNADGVLDVKNVSGATVARFGKRLDSYKSDYVSPSLSIDASTCYLPDNTWFIDGQFHGQGEWDEKTLDLLTKLLLTNELEDVYSDEAFPRYIYSQSPQDAVLIEFEESGPFVSAGNMTVTNLSREYDIEINRISIRNTFLKAELPDDTVLSPGESLTVEVSGKAPKVGTYTPVKISFTRMEEESDRRMTKVFGTSYR